jgi:hypothetical protein
VPLANANRSGQFSFSGTWSIQYFTVAGATCTSTPWPSYVADGVGIGGSGQSPIVNPGQSICVKVSVTSSSDSGKNVWYEIDNGDSPYPPAAKLFTIVSGSGSGSFIWSNAEFSSSVANCGTAPERLAEAAATVIPGNIDFAAHTADHFVNTAIGSTCSETVPTLDTSVSEKVVMVGRVVNDTAILNGVTDDAGGNVTYYLYANGVCSGPGKVVSSVTVTNGEVPGSDSVIINTAGLDSFGAVYSGDGKNHSATAACEPFAVVANNSVPEFPLGFGALGALAVLALMIMTRGKNQSPHLDQFSSRNQFGTLF